MPIKRASAAQIKKHFLITEDKQEARSHILDMVDQQMDKDEASKLVESIIDDLTEQAKENNVNLKEWNMFDRVTWIARQAYTLGFVQGWAVTMEAEEQGFIHLFGAEALGFAPGGFEPADLEGGDQT